MPLDQIAQKVVDGTLKVPFKTFPIDDIAEAHRAMEENTAGAKIVVLVWDWNREGVAIQTGKKKKWKIFFETMSESRDGFWTHSAFESLGNFASTVCE